jgi:hypothetical protein
MATPTNDRLSELMRTAGMSNKALARAVRAVADRHGDALSTNHTSVGRWLAGTAPRGATPSYLVEVFTQRLRRPVTLEDLGVVPAEVNDRLALTFEPSLRAAIETLAQLVRHDGQSHPLLDSGEFSADSVNALCLDWLVADSINDVRGPGVTMTDVDELVATTESLDTLDRAYGGGHHRAMAVRYLKDVVVPRLEAIRDDPPGREYLRAAAVLCELVGWMAYGQLRHSAAQRYFSQAVRLADAAGDQSYAAYVVASLAAQALWLERPKQALRLAQVAMDRGAAVHSAVAMTEALIYQARAHAALGNAAATRRASAFASDRFPGDELPSWANGWTPLVLASHTATCLVDLGAGEEAERTLAPIWEAAADQPRRRAYVAVQLGRAALIRGDVDQACSLVASAEAGLPPGARSLSAQLARRLRDQICSEHATHPSARELASTG